MPHRVVERRSKRAGTPRTVVAGVLGARVDVDGEDAGRVTGVLVHPREHAIGLEVTSPDSERRFLPLVAATLSNGVVDVPSALHLVESFDTYLDAGATVCRDVTCVDELRAAASRRRRGVVSRGPGAGNHKR